MKTRWKILIAAGVLLVLIVSSLLLNSHYQPSNALENYKKKLRDRGEKLELSEILPPPVPAESNSVAAVEDAFRLFVPGDTKIPDAMKMVAPGKALIGWQQPDARGYDFTNSWADFSAYTEANRPAIEQLYDVLKKPILVFNLDYKLGASMPLPQLAKMKRAVQCLELAAISDLQHGEPASAATNILTMLAMAKNNSSEGLLISHLVRLAMTAIAVVPTWELLQANNVSDTQLAAVQASWSQLDFFGDASNAFAVERAWSISIIKKLRAMSHEDLSAAIGGGSLGSSGPGGSGWDWETLTEKPRAAIGVFMWKSSWSYSDELRTLTGNSIILEALQSMQTNHSQFYKADYDRMTLRLSSLGITNAGAAFFRALKIPGLEEVFGGDALGNAVRKTLKTEAARRVVVVAIALKRFQLKHGNGPEKLAELVPQYLPSVPIDPYDGQPLRYHVNTDGTFSLYAVGEDGRDDGGDPAVAAVSRATLFWQHWQHNDSRDWVWPQSASALEIKTYYEEEAKKAK